MKETTVQIVMDTNFTEDEKQDFLLHCIEENLDFEGTPSEVRKQINTRMWNIARNERWKDDNRERLTRENEQEIRDIYSQHEEYSEDPSNLIEHEQELEGFLNSMSDMNRRTFERLYLDGLSPAELADEEGVERNAIDQRVHNIKKLVQEKFNG